MLDDKPMDPPAELVMKVRSMWGTEWVTTVRGESMSFAQYCATGGRPKDADSMKDHFWFLVEGLRSGRGGHSR